METSYTSGSMSEHKPMTFTDRLRALSPLRIDLMLTSLGLAALMPFAYLPSYDDNWNLFFNGVAPAVAPLIVIIQLMDMLMAKVWKDEDDPAGVAQLDFVIRCHQVTGSILLLGFLWSFLPVLLP